VMTCSIKLTQESRITRHPRRVMRGLAIKQYAFC